jgi:putative sterol carrier protein
MEEEKSVAKWENMLLVWQLVEENKENVASQEKAKKGMAVQYAKT